MREGLKTVVVLGVAVGWFTKTGRQGCWAVWVTVAVDTVGVVTVGPTGIPTKVGETFDTATVGLYTPAGKRLLGTKLDTVVKTGFCGTTTGNLGFSGAGIATGMNGFWG